MSENLIVEDSLDVLLQRLAGDVGLLIQETLRRQDRFLWALSGGKTPRRLYEMLAHEPYRSAIAWERLWIFWGDERAVPPDHAESNYRMASEALLQQVPIPAAQIFRIKGELPPLEAAAEYQRQLQKFARALLVPPVFDLILLGMGPDGHTASLFPGTPALAIKDRWAAANPVNALNTTRLTLTFPVLNAARQVWFLTTGADKAEAFARVRYTPDPLYPASLVQPRSGELRWYVDQAILHSA